MLLSLVCRFGILPSTLSQNVMSVQCQLGVPSISLPSLPLISLPSLCKVWDQRNADSCQVHPGARL